MGAAITGTTRRGHQAEGKSSPALLWHGLATACLCLGLLAGAGCRSVGPGTVTRDRLHYTTAMTNSWKEQLLLNIVKSRYGDAPAFLEIVSVVSGYSLETGVSLGGQFSPENLRGDTFVSGGLSGKFTDRPTISYAPMAGENFVRSLMAPVPPEALMSVIQGGVPADFILELTMQSIAGHYNHGMYAGQLQAADAEFATLLQLIRALQQARAMDTEVLKQGERVEVWLRFHPTEPSHTVMAGEVARLKALLGVPAEQNRVRVVVGTLAPEAGVVAMRPRSLLQILQTLGAGVQIPVDSTATGSAFPVHPSQVPSGFTVHSGKEKPDQAFAAVPYEGLWFWIERRDLPSKTTLAAVTILFNFLAGGSKVSPVLTIPTN
jgi:hypothetical protein